MTRAVKSGDIPAFSPSENELRGRRGNLQPQLRQEEGLVPERDESVPEGLVHRGVDVGSPLPTNPAEVSARNHRAAGVVKEQGEQQQPHHTR